MPRGDVPDTGRYEMRDRAMQPPGAGFCICCIITACLPIKAASISPQSNGNPHPDLVETSLLSEETGNVPISLCSPAW